MSFDVQELLAQVRRLRLAAARQVDELLAGEYRSAFRGQGMEFDEVREYAPGDDVRAIDWNVTARTGQPFIKIYREERELTCLLAIDISASSAFGSRGASKFEEMARVAALLMLTAQKSGDKVGLLLFADRVRAWFPARKGRGAARRLLRELVALQQDPTRLDEARVAGGDGPLAGTQGTDLDTALRFVSRVQKRRAIIFLMSDFQADAGYETALDFVGRRHEVVPVPVSDPLERELDEVGKGLGVRFVDVQDLETGAVATLDLGSAAGRAHYQRLAEAEAQGLSRSFRRIEGDPLEIRTDRPHAASLHRWFRARERRSTSRAGRRG